MKAKSTSFGASSQPTGGFDHLLRQSGSNFLAEHAPTADCGLDGFGHPGNAGLSHAERRELNLGRFT